ncbi:Uncharacterised protein [Candidatus Burarchaeum australiense]|nr:Uncharacterised protein [Candidatus Burarchaeum australiense]
MERAILKSVDYKCELLKVNFHYGKPIGKAKIPASYVLKSNATNLFHVELANRWRMQYSTFEGDMGEVIVYIQDISSHPDYDKKFKYRSR